MHSPKLTWILLYCASIPLYALALLSIGCSFYAMSGWFGASSTTSGAIAFGFLFLGIALIALMLYFLVVASNMGPPFKPRCPRCGYDLRALSSARCPECGEQRSPAGHAA